MVCDLYILGPKDRDLPGVQVVDVTSRSKQWSRGLSPFVLGPVEIYIEPNQRIVAHSVENAWQYSKCYSPHWDFENKQPKPEWYDWAAAGFASRKAVRYPMGKGAKPICSWFNGRQLDYIEARKAIYLPIYWNAVREAPAFRQLTEICQILNIVALWCFDGYNHRQLGMSLQDVLCSPDRKMGHSFVLAMMLQEIGVAQAEEG